jgi:hypothetical protein
MRTVGGLWAELTGPAAHGTEPGDSRAMLPHPRKLCIAKLAKAVLVVIDRANGRGGFRKPEGQIRVVPGKLVKVLGREAADLVRNQFCTGD